MKSFFKKASSPKSVKHKELHSKSAIYIDEKYYKLLTPQIKYVVNKLDEKELYSLKYYTSSGFEYINKILNYGKSSIPEGAVNVIKNYINKIDNVFKNIPPTTKTFVVYRGIKLDTKIDSDFTSLSYVSCTSDKNIALRFNAKKKMPCCLFEITIPKGSHVIPLETITEHKNEMEILLPRDSEFQIIHHNFTPTGNTVILKYVENNVMPI